ncbi:rhomboid family intramembrane serine protease [Cohnella fermenti]|uniref:Rhomboid family intramembrane serine protease n=1 Tax=Cohnella fermenti TaxID=2565925 RepID=A0A4S4C7E6_9BACL|nr:rhomboid family intramembrane serine protease [Cohnella fermenti]THF83868.1 rhomboid family intramembrane serine protease [Cohnella fermenti]
MIFVRYESWRQYLRLYPINSLILAACIAMFFVELASGGFTYGNLLRLGAISSIPGYDGIWRCAAALFLHGGWSHLIFNLFAIFVFAAPLERIFGHVRYAIFYLVTGVLGNAIAIWAAKEGMVGVGASTAIYGLYGAYLYICLFERQRLDNGSRTTVYGILATGLIYSFIVPNVGYWAHLGGLVMGFALYGLFGLKARRS